MASSADPSVLLVDDEPDILDLLSYNLEREGFQVATASNGADALRQAQANPPDVVVLDVMMPKMDGMETCRRFREDAALRLIPILMLTARGEERDEIEGLDAGADDYLIKPVSPRILVSRVRAALRRTERTEAATTQQLRVHDLLVDRERYVVERGEEVFRMPRKEFELLYFLASHPGRVFSREELLDAVWGPNVFVVDRTVDVHVRKIREKLGSAYIETVKGVGYKLAETLDAEAEASDG
jgi:two-component system alkaline phosphatase synthesis response regulator PhoP